MIEDLKKRALEKLAFYGPAGVSGAPVFYQPPYTVGQAMYDLNAYSSISGIKRRQALDDIVSSGIDVNSPVKRLFNAGMGALAGNTISKMLGANKFMRGMATAIGANYGYTS